MLVALKLKFIVQLIPYALFLCSCGGLHYASTTIEKRPFFDSHVLDLTNIFVEGELTSTVPLQLCTSVLIQIEVDQVKAIHGYS